MFNYGLWILLRILHLSIRQIIANDRKSQSEICPDMDSYLQEPHLLQLLFCCGSAVVLLWFSCCSVLAQLLFCCGSASVLLWFSCCFVVVQLLFCSDSAAVLLCYTQTKTIVWIERAFRSYVKWAFLYLYLLQLLFCCDSKICYTRTKTIAWIERACRSYVKWTFV